MIATTAITSMPRRIAPGSYARSIASGNPVHDVSFLVVATVGHRLTSSMLR